MGAGQKSEEEERAAGDQKERFQGRAAFKMQKAGDDKGGTNQANGAENFEEEEGEMEGTSNRPGDGSADGLKHRTVVAGLMDKPAIDIVKDRVAGEAGNVSNRVKERVEAIVALERSLGQVVKHIGADEWPTQGVNDPRSQQGKD